MLTPAVLLLSLAMRVQLCGPRCEQEFLRCHTQTGIHMRENHPDKVFHRYHAYNRCRSDIDNKRGLLGSTCQPSCIDTPEMRRANAAWRAESCHNASRVVKRQSDEDAAVASRTAASESSLRKTSSVRLAVLTFLSNDPLHMCYAFMRYYVGKQNIEPGDIHVLEIEAPKVGKDSMFAPCLRHFRVKNVRKTRYMVRGTFDEPTKQQELSRWQNELILGRGRAVGGKRSTSSRYTHTLVVDIDEFVLPDPTKYTSLLQYITAHRERAVIATHGFEVQPVRLTPEEPPPMPMNWSSPSLLGQRTHWAPLCPYSKPVLSRTTLTFSWATHEIAELPFSPCKAQPLDCVDSDLLLIHFTCIDATGAARYVSAKALANEAAAFSKTGRCSIIRDHIGADRGAGRSWTAWVAVKTGLAPPNVYGWWLQGRLPSEIPAAVRSAF